FGVLQQIVQQGGGFDEIDVVRHSYGLPKSSRGGQSVTGRSRRSGKIAQTGGSVPIMWALLADARRFFTAPDRIIPAFPRPPCTTGPPSLPSAPLQSRE